MVSGSRRPLVIGEAVQRAVELAVAAAVEAVAVRLSGGGGDRGRAGGAGELGVGGEAVGAGDLADQLGRGQRAAAALGEQLRRERCGERGELALEVVDRAVSSRMRRSSSRAIRTRALCSARARRRGDAVLPVGADQRARRDLGLGPEVVQLPAQVVAQRGALARPAARGDRRATAPRAPGRPAARRAGVSRPSRSAARAIATASMTSDLPGSRAALRAPAVSLGATRTTASPRASKNRSSAPETCRQSSIAHTRSPPRPRAQISSASKTAAAPRSSARRAADRSPHRRPRRCASAYACPRRSRSSRDLPFAGMPTNRIADGHFSVEAQATHLSGHAGDPRAAAGDITSVSHHAATESQRVSPSPARGPTGRVGRHRPTPETLALRKSRARDAISARISGVGSVAGGSRRVSDRLLWPRFR